MTKAEEAFEAAKAEIARVKAADEIRLDLNGSVNEAFRALAEIPAEIAELTNVTSLDLNSTSVSDLRPLRKLNQLVENPEFRGLSFTNCAAAKADPCIADIEENSERARQLFAYLEDWVPPLPSAEPCARSYGFDGTAPIRSSSDPVQSDDPDHEELRNDLHREAERLSETLGRSNQLGHLVSSVDHYAQQINRPLADIRIQLLYLAANSLRLDYEAHQDAKTQDRQIECLPPLVAAALQDVVETHALFFMGVTGQRNPDAATIAKDLVDSLRGLADVIDPEDQAALEDDLAASAGTGPSAEIGARSLIGSLGNAFLAVGRLPIATRASL